MQIVRTRAFEKSLKKLGASEADNAALEDEMATNPEAGAVIPGLHGARKMRFAMKGKGKRGGGRAIYVVIVLKDAAYLLLAYSKSEKADLSRDERRALAGMIKELQYG